MHYTNKTFIVLLLLLLLLFFFGQARSSGLFFPLLLELLDPSLQSSDGDGLSTLGQEPLVRLLHVPVRSSKRV
jgi:hypothetical protein